MATLSSSFTEQQLEAWSEQVSPTQTITGWRRQTSAIQGEAPSLHFLHGNGFSGLTLAAMASYLPHTWPLYFTNVPGHGGSSQPLSQMPDWQHMASDVAKAITMQCHTKQQGPVVGVGHSLGGVLSLLAAAKQQTSQPVFSRLILLDPVLFGPEVVLVQRVMRKTGLWHQLGLVKAVKRRQAQFASYDVMFEQLKQKKLYADWDERALWDFCLSAAEPTDTGVKLRCNPYWEAGIFGSYPRGLWQAIKTITIPVTILVAADSYFFIPPSAKKAAKLNPNIKFEVFGQGHCFPMSMPELAANKIMRLLAG